MGFLFPSTDARPTSWRDRSQQAGEITINEWIPRAVTMFNDNDEPTIIVLYPCKTCFKLCRFAPPELQAQEMDDVDGAQPIQDDISHGEMIQQLYRLFAIPDLSMMEHPPGRIYGAAGTYSGPSTNKSSRASDPGRIRRLPLLERPRNAAVYQLKEDEHYQPAVDMCDVADENRFADSPHRPENIECVLLLRPSG